LKPCVSDAVVAVTHSMLHNTSTDVECYLDICHDTRGAHIKIF
jgi:hypothetical protein